MSVNIDMNIKMKTKWNLTNRKMKINRDLEIKSRSLLYVSLFYLSKRK